jgi:hypothetical protein
MDKKMDYSKPLRKPNPNDYPFTCWGDDQYAYDLEEWERQQRQLQQQQRDAAIRQIGGGE